MRGKKSGQDLRRETGEKEEPHPGKETPAGRSCEPPDVMVSWAHDG